MPVGFLIWPGGRVLIQDTRASDAPTRRGGGSTQRAASLQPAPPPAHPPGWVRRCTAAPGGLRPPRGSNCRLRPPKDCRSRRRGRPGSACPVAANRAHNDSHGGSDARFCVSQCNRRTRCPDQQRRRGTQVGGDKHRQRAIQLRIAANGAGIVVGRAMRTLHASANLRLGADAPQRLGLAPYSGSQQGCAAVSPHPRPRSQNRSGERSEPTGLRGAPQPRRHPCRDVGVSGSCRTRDKRS